MLGKPHGQRSLVGSSPWKSHKSQTQLRDWTAMAYYLDDHHSIFWMCKRKGGSQNIHSWGNGEILWSIFACLVMSDSLQPFGLYPAWPFCPWDSSGKNTGEGCHFLLQGIFLTSILFFFLLLLLNCLFSCKAVASLYKNSTSKHSILQS